MRKEVAYHLLLLLLFVTIITIMISIFFFLLCEKVFEIDILFLPFTISMQCLLLIKTYVDVLVFCNVLFLQLVF